MAVSFDALMKGFGVVTVMNACIFTPKKAYTGARNCKTVVNVDGTYNVQSGGMSENDFEPAYEYIDTLKIANFTQEGPTKTVSGGQYANPLIKYGKTMTCEMQDALGRASTMVRFFGCEYNGSTIPVGGKVSAEVIGNGEDVYYILPNQLTSDNIDSLTWTVEGQASGDLTVSAELVSDAESEVYGYVKLTFSAVVADGDKVIVNATNNTQAPIGKAGSRLSITDKFPGPFAIEGDTFFIDQKTGEKKHVFIFIPQFIPDAILTLTQDAEGDATVFDLNGSVAVTDITDSEGSRSIFYEVRETSFFSNLRNAMVI